MEKTSEYRQRCLDTIEPTVKENEALKVVVEFLQGRVKELEDRETAMSAEKATRDEERAQFDRQRAGKYSLERVPDHICLLLTPLSAEAETEKTLLLEVVARLTAANDGARKRAEKLASDLEGKIEQLSCSPFSKSSCSAWSSYSQPPGSATRPSSTISEGRSGGIRISVRPWNKASLLS